VEPHRKLVSFRGDSYTTAYSKKEPTERLILKSFKMDVDMDDDLTIAPAKPSISGKIGGNVDDVIVRVVL